MEPWTGPFRGQSCQIFLQDDPYLGIPEGMWYIANAGSGMWY